MNTLIGALVTLVVVMLVLYLVNLLPLDARAKQIVLFFNAGPPGATDSSGEACRS